MDQRPVFISGLARAGTTILMRTLYETGRFRSLTYRDMPFVLMPNIWKKLSSTTRQHEAETERAHGDRIMVNFDSPEAFEEIFWRAFCADDYILNGCLRPHRPDIGVLEDFRLFVHHVLSSADTPGGLRYLSKNNNNILRLDSIAAAFPDSTIIIPFRDPLQHAISLKTQHYRFCDKHSKDDFSRQYMEWLAHYEFGHAHKPFCFNTADQAELHSYNPEDINYWLTLWLISYRHLYSTAPAGSLFICYEELCSSSSQVLTRIFEHAAISAETRNKCGNAVFSQAPDKSVAGINTEIVQNCNALYENLAAMTTAVVR